ncbi:hypothetical protein E6H11_02415 [Candidatus Bathyarchaeota archaeon]|nr:MAG: hypothetical protein E6H11_02415 [Candidatus Bathyarchaeota archaeon]
MPLKIIHPDHTEVVGEGLVLLFSPHITTSKRDLYTGQIVEEAALLSKSWAIVAKERGHPQSGDETESAEATLEKSVQDFVEEYGIKCVIAIRGAAEPGIAVKSRGDGSGLEEILDIIRSGVEPHFSVKPDVDQPGNKVLGLQGNDREPDNSSAQSLHIIQIELGPEERSFRKDQIVNIVADIVGLINAKLGFSVSGDEGSSGALD